MDSNAIRGFPGGSAVKTLPPSAGDVGSVIGLGGSLEEEMATHLSILACEIPQTEKPGGLQSMGLKRVGHDAVTKLQQSNLTDVLFKKINLFILIGG